MSVSDIQVLSWIFKKIQIFLVLLCCIKRILGQVKLWSHERAKPHKLMTENHQRVFPPCPPTNRTSALTLQFVHFLWDKASARFWGLQKKRCTKPAPPSGSSGLRFLHRCVSDKLVWPDPLFPPQLRRWLCSPLLFKHDLLVYFFLFVTPPIR